MDAEKRKKMAKEGFSTNPDFKELVTEGYYVDKSLLLRDIMDDHMQVKLFTRPRRFGKSLNLDMIQSFFEKTGEDTSVYFKDLDIWKCGDRYTSEQGRYPVIYLDLKECSGDTFESTMYLISDALSVEFLRHKELKGAVSEENLDEYDRIVKGTGDENDYMDSLRFLCELLCERHGVKPIVLIDEYDAPIQSGHGHKYYDKIVSFMGAFLSAGLKGNKYMSFAVVMGVTSALGDRMFSDLNNITPYTVLDDKYSPYFGFTEDEVKEILEDFGCPEKKEEISEWYDGYTFGNTKVFNPWSVMNYILYDLKPAPYWANTSGNGIIREMLDRTTKGVAENLVKLMGGEEIEASVDENITYKDLFDEPANVYSLLLMSGYLECVSAHGRVCSVAIPNKEVREIFKKEIMRMVWSDEGIPVTQRIADAVKAEDAETLKRELGLYIDRYMNYELLSAEYAYEILTAGLLGGLENVYCSLPEDRLPRARSDQVLVPKEKYAARLPAVVIEYEKCKEGDDVKARAQEGRNQIDDKGYDAKLRAFGFTDVFKVGLAFLGGEVASCTEYKKK